MINENFFLAVINFMKASEIQNSHSIVNEYPSYIGYLENMMKFGLDR